MGNELDEEYDEVECGLDDNSDYCYECSGYGDDYYEDPETGDLVCACFDCPFASWNEDEDY